MRKHMIAAGGIARQKRRIALPGEAPAESEIHAVLAALAEAPKAIARVTDGCSERQLLRKPRAEAWSALEIVAHLRACADVWGSSIERMLAEDHPTIRYISPRSWIKKTDYLQQSFRASLEAFSRRRAALLETLSQLSAIDWARRATVTATTLHDATVLSYARRIADHEALHLDQIQRTVGK